MYHGAVINFRTDPKDKRTTLVDIDGERVPGIEAQKIDASDGTSYELSALNAKGSEALGRLPLTLFRLPLSVFAIRLARRRGYQAPDWLDQISALRLPARARFDIRATLSFVDTSPTMLANAGPFTAAISAIPEISIRDLTLSPEGDISFTTEFRIEMPSLRAATDRLAELLQPAIAILEDRDGDDTIRLAFQFPAPVRSACEQYLLHFADFLRDLGGNASVELREIGDQVLFSVRPSDRDEALERVQVALDAYLEFPGTALVGDLDHDDRVVGYKLRANLAHLAGQLQLAMAQNELLRETIQTQRDTVDLLRYRTLPPPANDAVPDQEPITRYVSVTDIQKAGVTLRLPEILRDLKQLFRGKRE